MSNFLRGAMIGAAFMFGTAAAAATITDVSGDASFTGIAPIGTGSGGAYGLEVIGGQPGNWEIAVGQGTSRPGNFNQADYAWNAAFTPVSFSYDYGVTEANKATVNIDGTTLTYDFGSLQTGNTIRIFAKRDAQLFINDISGHSVSYTIGEDVADWDGTATNAGSYNDETLLLGSSMFTSGFTMEGTIVMRGGKGSAHSVVVSAGNIDVSPVPLPAAAWMLIAGVGGLGVMARRNNKRKAA